MNLNRVLTDAITIEALMAEKKLAEVEEEAESGVEPQAAETPKKGKKEKLVCICMCLNICMCQTILTVQCHRLKEYIFLHLLCCHWQPHMSLVLGGHTHINRL